MTIGFTKGELRKIYGHLSRLLPPGAGPLTAEQVVDVNDLLARTSTIIETAAELSERGAKIFEWRIPSEHAPTMNALAYMKGWQKGKLSRELEASLQAIMTVTPDARVHGLKTQRWVRFTRFTPNVSKIDDPNAVDATGGKLPIDTLKRMGVLVDDRPALCRREGMVRATKRGNTHVLIEVFHIAAEEVPDPGPMDGPCEKPAKRRKRSALVEHLEESAEASPPFGDLAPGKSPVVTRAVDLFLGKNRTRSVG